jgi:hypothetical protein
LANIFGLASAIKKCHVTYGSNKEDAFLMHMKDGIVKFERTPEGLYAYKPTKNFLRTVAERKQMKAPTAEPTVNLNTITDDQEGINCLVSTVSENRKGYTQRQFEDAKAARRLYHVMGCPGAENFKNLLRQNIIMNCPVTVDHVNIAEKIFGPDIGSLKGKTTRKKPTPV